MMEDLEALPISLLRIERRIISGVVTSETELFVWDLRRRLERSVLFIVSDVLVIVREHCDARVRRRL